MAIIKPVIKTMPDGSLGAVLPYHVSFEGLEKAIICRDDEDCDVMVKCVFVCARRKNVLVITYGVVSNHAHLAILARSFWDAMAFAQELKRMYSQLFQKKCSESKVLRHTDVCVLLLDTDWYLRNALAYIIRNAFDNGAINLTDYKWTGFRACFRDKSQPIEGIPVSKMTTREWRNHFHTGDSLASVPWVLNSQYELEPASACEIDYLESAFAKDEAFFYKSVGIVNVAEMTQKLVINPRQSLTDAVFFKEMESISQRWYSTCVSSLSITQKARLIPYVYHIMKTNVNQLSRGFGLSREEVSRLLNL